MQTRIEYRHLTEALDRFRLLWSGRNTHALDAEVRYDSSHRGNAVGIPAVTALLHSDFADMDAVDLQFTNAVLRANGASWVAGAYVLGRAERAGAAVLFGGALVLEGTATSDGLTITLARVQIYWSNGDRSLLSHWQLPSEQRWQQGDAEAILVSELDAPVRRLAHSTLALSDEQAIAQAWYTYAWGLDLADFALFQHVFTEDATALLPPIGELRSRRSLMAALKAFRMPWPWMQHFGTPLDIALADDGQSARLIVGRIIPGETRTPDGEALYGAHYRIELRRQQDAWRIQRIEYHPGWIKAAGA